MPECGKIRKSFGCSCQNNSGDIEHLWYCDKTEKLNLLGRLNYEKHTPSMLLIKSCKMRHLFNAHPVGRGPTNDDNIKGRRTLRERVFIIPPISGQHRTQHENSAT